MISRLNLPPYHISQLSEFCAAHPTARKFVFVASRQVGYDLLNTLARAGIGWVNLEAISPREHLEQTVEPQLKARGLTPLRRDTAVVIVADLLRQLKAQDAGSYFEPVAVTPSLARSVWETLQALRTAGVSANALREAPIQTEKSRALADLADAFDRTLANRNLYDTAFAFDVALREGPRDCDDQFAAIMDECPLTLRGQKYLRRIFGNRITRIGRNEYGVPSPRSTGAGVLKSIDVTSGVVGAAGAVKSRPLADEDIDLIDVFGSRGPDQEVTDVIRNCLDQGIPFDEVEIAYSNAAVYVPHLVSAADRFDIEISFSEGVPATLTRPGAGLKGYLDWISSGCRASDLTDLLGAGLLSFHRAVPDVGLDQMPGLTSHFRKAALEEGVHRYLPGLSALAESGHRWNRPQEATEETPFDIRSRLLSQGIEKLVETVPTGAQLRTVDLADLCLGFLDQFAVIHGERDERAIESLSDRFSQLGSAFQTRLPVRLGLQLLADMVDQHTVQAAVSRPGALHAVPIERAGYTGRKQLFVIGLDVDNFPGRSGEDPILLDIEREQLSLGLELKSSSATDRTWHLIRALGMSPGRVALGTSVLNPEREEAVVYPSPFFQSLAKQVDVDYLRPPSLSTGDIYLTDTEALLPQRRRIDFQAFVSDHYPWMRVGHHAVASRAEAEFSEYDGWLGSGNPFGDDFERRTVYSANRLEKLAACPYRYFLHYVLGIRKPDYYEPDPTRWLDPRDFGTLLHDLYHRFLLELRELNEQPNLEQHGDRIRQLVTESIEEYLKRVPADNQAAFEYERSRLVASAMAFLRSESSYQTARPILFEFVFGSKDATTESLANPVTIRLDDAISFKLRGRIDRVDESEDGSLVIWDYKTGSSYKFNGDSLLNGGLNLQWVLYAYAIEELSPNIGLSGRVKSSGYYFANDRENARKIAEVPPPRETLGRVLNPLMSMVRQGAFLHATKNEGECKFCDFRTICSSESKTKKTLRGVWTSNAGRPFIDSLSEWMEDS